MDDLKTQPKVIGVGLISFGMSGRVFHAPFVLSHPLFRLVAAYERGEKTDAAQFCAERGHHGVLTARSVDELCRVEDVELVVVCRCAHLELILSLYLIVFRPSPIEFHFEHAAAALQSGLHSTSCLLQ
jgi:scyllo-inositol 2-dehydrogenase (NADP+)